MEDRMPYIEISFGLQGISVKDCLLINISHQEA